MIDLSEAGRQLRDATSETPSSIEVLLERNRRRRRRRVTQRAAAAAVIVVAAIVLGAGLALRSSHGTTLRVDGVAGSQGRGGTTSPAATSTSGEVTGKILRCSGLGTPTGVSPYTGGTVVAQRGVVTYQQTSPFGGQTILPTDAVATQTVQPGQAFDFALPAGNYVLHLTHYSDAPIGARATSWAQVVIHKGEVVHQDMPNRCK
jgi:hypothetical protein